MKTRVLTMDGDEEVGEVSNLAELVDLLKEWGLTPDDIWFSIPNDALWDELIECWE